MKIKGKILIPIFAMVYLAVLAIAAIPPPPVNQNFGINDTMLTSYNEPLCRGCHNSTASPLVTGGVPTRHHLLVSTSTINPLTSAPFVCQDCHPSTPGIGNGILLNRNCMDCHSGTAFNNSGARVGGFTRPHHNTTQAQVRNCKFCHGASVDDYNDGHYIPPYPPSEITPNALYNENGINYTSMRVWGGCLACHRENLAASPPIFFTHTDGFPPVASGTNNSHHNEILTITGGTSDGDKCLWCHGNLPDVLDIRGCESCHSVRSIHNIQYDFANTSTKLGYGHIGSNTTDANGSWDCKGCHAWYDAGDVNPFAGAIIPDVQLATPDVFLANTPTVVTLTGTNFVQDGSTTVVKIDDSTTLTPDTISNGQITVTVNLAAGAHYIKVVKTDAVENVPKPSDIKHLTIVDKVTITSATLNGGTLTISGTGLGSKPTSNAEQYVIAGSAGYSASITSWSDTQIVATVSGTVASGDSTTVITANGGQATTTIVASTPTPSPTATPTPPGITSAKLVSGVLTIDGSGFETKPRNNPQNSVTTVQSGKKYTSSSITSWTTAKIVAKVNSKTWKVGQPVTVTTVSGIKYTATIT